jgi:geranylgeranyl diphosphate synthase, type I
MSALDTSSTGLQAFLSPRMVRSTVRPVTWQQASALEPTPARIGSYHPGFIDLRPDRLRQGGPNLDSGGGRQ